MSVMMQNLKYKILRRQAIRVYDVSLASPQIRASGEILSGEYNAEIHTDSDRNCWLLIPQHGVKTLIRDSIHHFGNGHLDYEQFLMRDNDRIQPETEYTMAELERDITRGRYLKAKAKKYTEFTGKRIYSFEDYALCRDNPRQNRPTIDSSDYYEFDSLTLVIDHVRMCNGYDVRQGFVPIVKSGRDVIKRGDFVRGVFDTEYQIAYQAGKDMIDNVIRET